MIHNFAASCTHDSSPSLIASGSSQSPVKLDLRLLRLMDTVGFLRPFNDPDLPSGIFDFCGSKLSWDELCDRMKGNAVTLWNRVERKILK